MPQLLNKDTITIKTLFLPNEDIDTQMEKLDLLCRICMFGSYANQFAGHPLIANSDNINVYIGNHHNYGLRIQETAFVSRFNDVVVIISASLSILSIGPRQYYKFDSQGTELDYMDEQIIFKDTFQYLQDNHLKLKYNGNNNLYISIGENELNAELYPDFRE